MSVNLRHDQFDIHLGEIGEDELEIDIHGFSKGLGQVSVDYMKKMLKEKSIPIEKMTIRDFIEKIINTALSTLLPEEKELKERKQAQCIMALEAISKSDKYRVKLEEILPFIFAFLMHGKQMGMNFETSECIDLFLNQSLVEAATAYNGDDSISCIEGIFERFISGLRTIHPVIDIFFLTSTVMTAYFPSGAGIHDPKIEMLLEEDFLKDLIISLKQKGIEYVDSDQTSSKSGFGILKQKVGMYFLERIQKTFELQLDEYVEKVKPFLPKKYDLKEIAMNIWSSKANEMHMTICVIVNLLENLDLSKGINSEEFTFIAVVNQMLSNLKASIFGDSTFTDISNEDISDEVQEMLQKIKDVTDPEKLRAQQFLSAANELIATETIVREQLSRELANEMRDSIEIYTQTKQQINEREKQSKTADLKKQLAIIEEQLKLLNQMELTLP